VNKVRERRKALGVSLDELAAALGPGFSHARLSIAERGLIQLSALEEEIIYDTVERLGELRSQVRRVIETASSIDLVSMCEDLRQRAQVLQAP
jgi:transcriptional regulator with XRE-family HTH domain